ncbi:MAG: c-type cytochrome [Acidobacteria bacterium]|nr:c-type cytochrome [Acidobacteriota bacterium]
MGFRIGISDFSDFWNLLESGIWNLEFGIWNLESGIWNLVNFRSNMKNTIKILAVIGFTVFAGSFLAKSGSTQTKQVETAGQKFKSIKVLNEMPADQMGKVMNMISASLGVDCKFCHASNDADYEKEGFEHKDIARQMLKMTFELNKKYFEGRPEINCNSCHQGKSHPQPTFPLKPVEQEPRPAQPTTKPTVDEILAKYAAALGKGDIKSRQITGQRIEPDGKTVEPEEVLQKGEKMSVKTTYGTYVVREIYDGKTAAKYGNADKIQLKPDEMEQIKREAQIFANANLKAIYPKLEFRFVDRIDGREVNLLLATNADNSRERLYFDVQTGLLVRRVASAPTVLGNFQFQVDYIDYKDFGGVKIPTVVKFAVPNIRWTRKVLDVKINVPVGDTVFAND